MTKTTIVIPNYNGIKYIEECIKSIRTAGDYPLIIVDNGSCDGSAEVIRDLIAAEESEHGSSRTSLISLPENTGFCHAVNVGIDHTETPYVFLLNNDTTITPDTISALEAVLDADKRVFSAQSKLLKMSDPGRIDDAGDLYCALGWAFARGKDKPAAMYDKPARVFACCGAAVMYRMSMLEDVGSFDERHFAYLEDIDMGYRARILGFKNVYEPSSVVFHAGSAVSGSRHNDFKVKLSAANSIYLIYKNMPLLQLVINLPFLIAGVLIKIAYFVRKKLARAYISGLRAGFGKCGDDIFDRRRHKVRFHVRNLGHLIVIQLELWFNMFRRTS